MIVKIVLILANEHAWHRLLIATYYSLALLQASAADPSPVLTEGRTYKSDVPRANRCLQGRSQQTKPPMSVLCHNAVNSIHEQFKTLIAKSSMSWVSALLYLFFLS